MKIDRSNIKNSDCVGIDSPVKFLQSHLRIINIPIQDYWKVNSYKYLSGPLIGKAVYSLSTNFELNKKWIFTADSKVYLINNYLLNSLQAEGYYYTMNCFLQLFIFGGTYGNLFWNILSTNNKNKIVYSFYYDDPDLMQTVEVEAISYKSTSSNIKYVKYPYLIINSKDILSGTVNYTINYGDAKINGVANKSLGKGEVTARWGSVIWKINKTNNTIAFYFSFPFQAPFFMGETLI